MAFLDPVFDPILQPLINLSPFWAIVILAVIVSLLITLVYKVATDQKKMKDMKGKQKDYQKQMKELRSNPEEMMKVQKEAMKLNMEYMKSSFKPTLITMIPILLIFGWMAGHLSFEPIYPGETYSVSADFLEEIKGEAELIADEGTELIDLAKQDIIGGKATWKIKSSEGEHYLTVKVGKDEQSKKVLITKELRTEEAVSIFQHSDIKQITINYNKLRPLGTFEIFGWQPGWLGLYIIFSLIFSMVLRKLLKIY
jgi:uncharacterized membrane protein (DUF106 family)